jgi:hypothetical protein
MRSKHRLAGKMPAMVAVIDVRLDNLSGYIANTAEKLSRAPKVAFAKMLAQPRMLAEKLVGAAAFQKLKSFGNAQHRGQTDEQVDVVRFNLKLENLHIMGFSNLAQKLFAMLADNRKLKRVFGVFWLPHKVERVLADAMLVVYKSFHFSVPPRIFCGAHAKCVWEIECANSVAHSSLYQEGRKYRGGRSKERRYFSSQFLPDLKVGGILASL